MKLPWFRKTTHIPQIHKFSAGRPDREYEAHRYPNVWTRHNDGHADRLIIGPANRHIAMLVEMLGYMRGPFEVRYALIDPPDDRFEAGLYDCTQKWEQRDTAMFLWRFQELFETCGRADICVYGNAGESMLVYERHNVIYAYGPLEKWEGYLSSNGFSEGELVIPSPHTHGFNPGLNHLVEEMFRDFQWERQPISEQNV